MPKPKASSNNEQRTEKTTVYLSPAALKKIDSGMVLRDMHSRSLFMEQAINFYCGYLFAQSYSDYVSSAIMGSLESTVKNSENRLARLMFKEAVELAKLTQMLASINEMDDDTLEDLHYKCVQDVKRINGTIKFEDAVRNYNNDDEN
jgi:hypothetical protein